MARVGAGADQGGAETAAVPGVRAVAIPAGGVLRAGAATEEGGLMADEVQPRTPTETLLACLTRFGEAEPMRAIVVWTDETGDLCWSCSGVRSYTSLIGMLECVKAVLMAEFMEVRD